MKPSTKISGCQDGYTLIEMLSVVMVIAAIMIGSFTTWKIQLQKSQDAKRKSDINKLKITFEEYFNDREEYPPLSTTSHCGQGDLKNFGMRVIPCDPNGSGYVYQWIDPANPRSGFRIYAKLKVKQDADITKLGCTQTAGCNVPGCPDCNYGVAIGGTVAQ